MATGRTMPNDTGAPAAQWQLDELQAEVTEVSGPEHRVMPGSSKAAVAP